MEKVLFNYFELEAFLKKFREFSETDPDIDPSFRALEAQVRREEFLCRADKARHVVFGNERFSSSVKNRYYDVQRAFKECYGLLLPDV